MKKEIRDALAHHRNKLNEHISKYEESYLDLQREKK